MNWAQIKAIPNPVAGLTVYDVGSKVLRTYDGTQWTVVGGTGSGPFDAPGTSSTISRTGYCVIGCIKLLPDKSLLVGGRATANSSIGGLTFSAPGAYFAKLDSNGVGVFMVQHSGNTTSSNNSFIGAIDADPSGNIYVSGTYNGTVNFNLAGSNTLTSVGNSSDVFIARYSPSGVYNWAASMGGTNSESAMSIATDGTAVYAGGQFYSPTFTTSCGSSTLR